MIRLTFPYRFPFAILAGSRQDRKHAPDRTPNGFFLPPRTRRCYPDKPTHPGGTQPFGACGPMNRKDTRWLFLVLCIMIACGGLSHAQQKDKPPRPNFTVSKETTYVDGPLTREGYIDYTAALNKRLSEAVTPENNANV